MGKQNTLTLADLPGLRAGLLVVIELDHRKGNNYYFRCRCDCGKEVVKRSTQFYYGKFFTCGSPECRFWEAVNKEGPIASDALGPCWIWTKSLKETGYGVYLPSPGKTCRAHVYSWKLHFGPKPKGGWVLHKCDNRRCVRPSHLFLGDHQVNTRDMADKKRAARYGKVFLSVDEKQAMIDTYSQGGKPHQALAADFSVSLSTVRRTLRGASSRRQ